MGRGFVLTGKREARSDSLGSTIPSCAILERTQSLRSLAAFGCRMGEYLLGERMTPASRAASSRDSSPTLFEK